MTLQISQTLDARGLSCPMPIVKTVLATDPGSVKDFAAWSRTTGNELVEQTADGGVFRFVLRRK